MFSKQQNSIHFSILFSFDFKPTKIRSRASFTRMHRAGFCFLFSLLHDISYGCSWCSNNFKKYFSIFQAIIQQGTKLATSKDGLIRERRADGNGVYILLCKMVFRPIRTRVLSKLFYNIHFFRLVVFQCFRITQAQIRFCLGACHLTKCNKESFTIRCLSFQDFFLSSTHVQAQLQANSLPEVNSILILKTLEEEVSSVSNTV